MAIYVFFLSLLDHQSNTMETKKKQTKDTNKFFYLIIVISIETESNIFLLKSEISERNKEREKEESKQKKTITHIEY